MRVVIAVSDVKNAARLVHGALNYGLSDKDEIAVITIVNSDNVRVWSFLPPPLVDEILSEIDHDARVALREAGLALRGELHSSHVHEFKLDGDLADQLNDFLLNWKADLLIIGFSENQPWNDHACKIVTTSVCPVLVVGRNTHESAGTEPEQKNWHEPAYII